MLSFFPAFAISLLQKGGSVQGEEAAWALVLLNLSSAPASRMTSGKACAL